MFGHLPIVFDSAALGERDTFGFAREEYGRKALNVDLDAPRDIDYRLRIRARSFGTVRVAVIDSSPYRVSRTRKLIDDGDDRIGMVFPLAGRFSGQQGGRDVSVARGEATTMLADRTGWFGTASGGAFLTIRASPALVASHAGGLARFRNGIAVRPSKPALDLMRSYLSSLGRAAAEMPGDLQELAGRHLAELAAYALCDPGASPLSLPDGEGVRAARAAAARMHMVEHFADPSYGVGHCAAHLGISVRYLQLLLEAQGVRFSEELKRLRLERARSMLADPQNAGMRVVDIAFESGFSDVSHFNRQSRACFGESPTSARGAAWVRSGSCDKT